MRGPSRRTVLKTLAGSAASLAGLGGYAFAVEPGSACACSATP